MNPSEKITPEHLRRQAYLYIRQSTALQIEHNIESTQRQYHFRDQAVAMGWSADQVVVIDDDLGQSGAATAGRDGFARLVADVGLGQVGIVLALEVSRLARNCSDWHRLLEICALSLCGEVFSAPAPAGVGEEKYDPESAAMIGLLKYGTGLPFHRLERLQEGLGIPLPAATQWEIVAQTAGVLAPALAEMIHHAAQGQILHNDDTTMKVLALGQAAAEPAAAAAEPAAGAAAAPTAQGRTDPEGAGDACDRKGVFTSGIVSKTGDHQIALFFTGHKHAGENLFDLLQQRSSELGPPIQMCDALSRNVPAALRTLLANCMAHSRRRFVDVAGSFPNECLHVLEILKDVYHNDAIAKGRGMSPEERLRFHQAQSGPRMAELQAWMETQITQRKVEPNSGLGEAIAYMRKHWDKLTLFLRVPGAPLDNNVCERALKKAILHRKNALYYKTQNGARVGDLFMSLIHTCELNGANPFHYLTELQKHARELAATPADWMPWNYHHALESGQSRPAG